MKKCTLCLKYYSHLQFNKSSTSPDGLTTYCRKCFNNYLHTYYLKNKDRFRRRMHIYYKKNKQQIIAYSLQYKKQNPDVVKKSSNSPRGRFRIYKAGAKSRGIKFNLSFEEFIIFWQRPCYYCGDSVETIGIDRIDSSKCYEIKNIVACCSACNWGKQAFTKDEFLSMCLKIVKKHKLL